MCKAQIAGPLNLLEDTLSFVRSAGILQIEPSNIQRLNKREKTANLINTVDSKFVFEKIFYENLKKRIDNLFGHIPDSKIRMSYFVNIKPIIDTVDITIDRHIDTLSKLSVEKTQYSETLKELKNYKDFLKITNEMAGPILSSGKLDFIGVILKDASGEDILRTQLNDLTEGGFDLTTTDYKNGSKIGVIVLSKKIYPKIADALGKEQMPEFAFPGHIRELPFKDKLPYVDNMIADIKPRLKLTNDKILEFIKRWGPIYVSVRDAVNEHLSILKTSQQVFKTERTFFIIGWIQCEEINNFKLLLEKTFNNKVFLEKLEIIKEDLTRIPVIIKNSRYFKHFELLSGMLPIPLYASYDPTIFIGIFFPLFFGIILGDIAYGIFIAIISLSLVKKFKSNPLIKDVGSILLISSIYTIIFGIMYGEFLGDFGHKSLGIKPLLFERKEDIMPMIYFALSIGLAHIILGLSLGFISTLRRNMKKEAVNKLINIVVLLLIPGVLISMMGFISKIITLPFIITIVLLIILLIFSGGFLAPLELLKNIGHIISYVRIMAIGFTSVLLAYIANRMFGLIGDVMLGILVASLLHMLNLVIAIFSPSIHSLRLHYVEFFDKFLESGGKKFEPYDKNQ